MLKKGLMLATLLGVMLPSLAMAGTLSLTTRVNSSGGTLQVGSGSVQSIGAKFKNYSTPQAAADLTVHLTPVTGNSISVLKLNGVKQTITGAAQDVVLNQSNTKQTVAVWFVKKRVPVTATVGGGGSVYPKGTLNVKYGTIKSYTFTPYTNKNVKSITINGTEYTNTPPAGYAFRNVADTADVTLPGAIGARVKVKFTVPDTASITLAAKFQDVTANAGAPKTVTPIGPFTLDGTGTIGATTYAWTLTAGPTGTFANENTATATFTPSAAGKYTFKLTVTGLGETSYAYTTVTVASSALGAVQLTCGGCHRASTPTVYNNWSTGSHGNKTTLCSKCHVGTDTGAHPGTVPASIQLGTPAAITPDTNGFVTANACQNCHKASHDQWKESLHTLKAKKGPALLAGSTENISPWAITNWDSMKTYQILGRKANITSKNYIEMYVSVDKKPYTDVAVVIGQDRKQRYGVYYDGSAQQAKVVYSNNGGITYREKMIDHDSDPGTPTIWEEVAMPAQPDRAGYTFLWLEVKLTGAAPAMNGDNYEEWRSWQERCIGCHTTGFDRVAYNSAKSAYVAAFAANGNQPPVGLDMRTVYVSEWEVSCEACHGAGSQHAQTGDKALIVSPATLAQGDHVRREVCESCHTRTNKNKIDTATANDRRGFRLGIDSYGDWMDYTDPAWGTGNRQVSIDGKGRRDHQMTMDIQLSKYIHEVVEGGFSYHGNQNCFDCHKSHDVGINKNGVNVWKENMLALKYGHDNMTSLATDDGVRSTLRLKDTREALCSPCHVTAAPAGVLPGGVTAPQYASVTDLVKVFDAKTGASYNYTFDAAAAVLDTALYATDPTAATNALSLVASNWATEGGRDKRQSHIFNKDAAAVPTNKAMGLKPAEYTWEIATARVGALDTATTEYKAIWPWANASSGKTKVYGPLTELATNPPLASRPWVDLP